MMVGARVPGCRGCGARTAHGGESKDLTVEADVDRYEVRVNGQVLGRFRSVVAAGVFAKGHPRSTVHPVRP